MTPPNVLLAGIVGSVAYGLAGPDSDIDRLGVFAVPTVALHGLGQPVETVATTGPDSTYHEARKYCRLALAANPTVMDVMWLPDDLYEIRTVLGDELIAIRSSFLSAPRVHDAFLGYADRQFRKLEARADGSFSADTRRRTAKHARHLMRLCHQGLLAYTTGVVRIRLDEPQRFHDFGEEVAGGNLDAARAMLHRYHEAFDQARTVLPDQPDSAVAEAWLLRVREAHL